MICAHRGLSSTCPENTLPAFAAALGTAADEIELDLWLTQDGVPIVCHDPNLLRTTGTDGLIEELSWLEIQSADAGYYRGEEWSGVRVPCFEEVLDLVDGRAVLNVHIKQAGVEGALIRLVCEALAERDLSDLAYIAGEEPVLDWATKICPALPRACLGSQNDCIRQVEIAQRYECARIQFGRNVTDEAIAAAKEYGMVCNLFWSDEVAEARGFLRRGIDVILTNACHIVSRDRLI